MAALVAAGVDVARINACHGTPEQHASLIAAARAAGAAAGRPVAVLLDLQGPRIRVGELAAPVSLEPGLGEAGILAAAQAAYQAHPGAIPFESPRYRGWADLDHDGVLSGQAELLPLYVVAARDFYQPLFAYGPPRLVRLGVEFIF